LRCCCSAWHIRFDFCSARIHIRDIADTVTDELITKLRQCLAKEAESALLWLQANPMTVASRTLRGSNNQLKMGRDSMKLRRLATEKAPGLTIQSGNNYMRVVYGHDRNGLIIVDVLPHDEFDRKYP
jgi:hypothetical protein